MADNSDDTKIDMSLDEIIKKEGISGAKRGSRGGLRGGRGGNAARANGRTFVGTLRTSGGGGGVSRIRTNRQTPYTRASRMPADKWQHDMYEGSSRARLGGGIGGGGSGAKSHLLVSNLDYGVSDDDIKELFAEFGYLRKASVHYEKSGRSLGTADVIFEKRSDAVNAMKQYNGVPLDGRPMKIQLVNGEQQSGPRSIGGQNFGNFNKPNNTKFTGTGRGGGSGGRGRGRGGGGRRIGGAASGGNRGGKAPTAEELDADLDAYVNKMN